MAKVLSALHLRLAESWLGIRKRWILWRYPDVREWDFDELESRRNPRV